MKYFLKVLFSGWLIIVLSQSAAAQQPNIIVIIADDHRWDATSFMQDRMPGLGRTARFPWLDGTTPNLDRLSSEGVHFDNAFTVFSTCSPSRATMLSGVYPHIHGITNNSTPFPTDITTYASLLRESNYTTGYFGKWHHGQQTQRPGFDEVVTFHGQGTYFSTRLFNGQNTLIRQTSSTEWIDDVSTSYAIDFINDHANSADPFMLVLGFKTPHQPWEPPVRTQNDFSTDSAQSVPNLNAPPPGQNITTNSGNYASTLRNYMRTVIGIDHCVGEVLDRLEALNISDNTAVIYISDNGFFRGEHMLGDKRAPYEESIRIPLMIRYPNAQSSPRIVNEMALNLDMAPTILDIAGLPIPEHMQGVSLLPLMTDEAPDTWRSSFFYQYNHDPEFPTARVRPYIALRHENGLKLVYYEEDPSWSEFFDTNISADPYEINNLISASNYSDSLEVMKHVLRQEINDAEFIKPFEITRNGASVLAQLKLGANYNFNIQSSLDLATWTSQSVMGDGAASNYSLVSGSSGSGSHTSISNPNDYEIIDGNGGSNTINDSGSTLKVGSYAGWESGDNSLGGRNAVLIFEMPPVIEGYLIQNAELEITAYRKYNPGTIWEADLYTLGIYDTSDPINEFSETPTGNTNVVALDTGLLTFASITTDTTGNVVTTPYPSNLSDYIRSFYAANPNYNGGKYIFLRLNPNINPGNMAAKFFVYSGNESDAEKRPTLKFHYEAVTEAPASLYYRVRYGTH